MNPMKQKYRSVFIIASIFLLLLFAQVIMYGIFFSELRTDTEVINELSRIRGSIQRYTNLELAEPGSGRELAAEIDNLITRNMKTPAEADLDSVSELYDMRLLNIKWYALKLTIGDYQADQAQADLHAVIERSEECWEVADASVIQQQYIVNKTAEYYKYFTVTFGINLFFVVLMVFFYKRYIHNRLASSAIHDSLTGVFNKDYFSQYLDYEIALAVRKDRPFSLIMLDIDHFKHVNDTYGHRRGDYALKALADVVVKTKRNADVLARIGGEEFIILLPDTRRSDANRLAERIRACVEAFPFEEIGKMTISLGVTEFTMKDDHEGILKRVDTAMYLAKENGRNRCETLGGEIYE